MMKKGIVLLWAVLALITGVAPVWAQQEYNYRVPFSVSVQSCTGEEIYLTGEIHFLYHQRYDPKGGMHVLWHVNYQGVSGIGLTTGTLYHVSSLSNFSSRVAVSGTQWSNTYVNNWRLIGAGSGPVETLHAVYKVTVNARGELTATVDLSHYECS